MKDVYVTFVLYTVCLVYPSYCYFTNRIVEFGSKPPVSHIPSISGGPYVSHIGDLFGGAHVPRGRGSSMSAMGAKRTDASDGFNFPILLKQTDNKHLPALLISAAGSDAYRAHS